MTNETFSDIEKIETLLPATRYAPAGFTGSWHFKAGTKLFIRNLIATHIPTETYDCWTLEPAPSHVQEAYWTVLSFATDSEGGAVFYRGQIIGRFTPSGIAGQQNLPHMERAAPNDFEGMNTDRFPPRIENGSTIRYLADGSITIIDHAD